MYIVNRSVRLLRGLLLSYGPQKIKRHVWDQEYASDKWNFADHTVGDCVYAHLERYASNGSILDLGCGSGNTATEMVGSYKSYIGVDISENALDKAAKRSKETGRQDKNRFVCSDFISYVPAEKFDVILFRESMYHVPMRRIKATLDHYSRYLNEGGVFIVRLFAASRENSKSKNRPAAMLSIMESEFDVLEKRQYGDLGLPTVIVFRPKKSPAQEVSGDTRRVKDARSPVSA